MESISKRAPVTGILLLTVSLLLPAMAVADDTGKARAHFEQGIELYEEGKFEQAAISFQRAYELRPSYKLLYNIAQTENQIGNYTAALTAYSNYLSEGGAEIGDERKAEVKAEIEKLHGKVGRIAVKSSVEGAEIYVNGSHKGEVPLTDIIFVDAGEHEVVLRLEGEIIHEEEVLVEGGKQVTVEVEATPEDEEEDIEDEPSPKKKRIWTWVALGVGGAAAVGAGVTGGLAISKTEDVKSECNDNSCPPGEKDNADKAKTMGTVSTVLTGVAAAGIAAAVILFFVEPGLHEEEGVTVSPSVSQDGAGLFVTGRF